MREAYVRMQPISLIKVIMITRMRLILSIFFAASLVLFISLAHADITSALRDFTAPVMSLGKILHVVCLMTGIGVLAVGIGKFRDYRQHRDVHISSIIGLFLAGLALIGLSFLPLPAVFL